MNQLLELISASVIGAFILLIAIALNMQISDSSREIFESSHNQSNVITASYVIEYDLYKAGNRVTGEKVISADSNSVSFKTDLDNNGSIDTVQYFTGNPAELNTTPNPNDKQLFRKINNQNPNLVSIVTKFNLVYYDSIGNILNNSLLINPSERNKIKGIMVYVKTELPDEIKDQYNPLEWRKTIRPKNL